MKLSSVITFISRKAAFLLTLAFAAGLLFTGCSKETPATTTTTSNISNDDISQAVTNAVSASSSGQQNIINASSCASFIGAGFLNQVGNLAAGSCAVKRGFIGGGTKNCIDSSTSTYSLYNSIVGGCQNKICANINNSAILGGYNNTVNSSYSSIFGGSGNTIAATFPYAGVFGQNVAAQAPHTFHVECLNACATPSILSGPFPTGTFSYYTVTGAFPTGLLPGTKLLVIS